MAALGLLQTYNKCGCPSSSTALFPPLCGQFPGVGSGCAPLKTPGTLPMVRTHEMLQVLDWAQEWDVWGEWGRAEVTERDCQAVCSGWHGVNASLRTAVTISRALLPAGLGASRLPAVLGPPAPPALATGGQCKILQRRSRQWAGSGL